MEKPNTFKKGTSQVGSVSRPTLCDLEGQPVNPLNHINYKYIQKYIFILHALILIHQKTQVIIFTTTFPPGKPIPPNQPRHIIRQFWSYDATRDAHQERCRWFQGPTKGVGQNGKIGMFLSRDFVSSLAPFLLLCFFCWFGLLLVDFLVVVVAKEFWDEGLQQETCFWVYRNKKGDHWKKHTHDLKSFLLGSTNSYLGRIVNGYFTLVISSAYCKITAKWCSQPLQHPTTNLLVGGWWSHQPLPRCPFQGKEQGSQSFQDP